MIDDIARKASGGNQDAYQFLKDVFYIAHLWDDLIDKDPRTERDISAAFWLALVALPNNPFYVKYFQMLNPVLMIATQNWLASNTLAKTKQPDNLEISHILRGSYIDMFGQVALITGGPIMAQEVIIDARAFLHQEGLESYMKEVCHG